jgi:uncharacterized membrane protein
MATSGMQLIRRAPPWGIIVTLGALAALALWFILQKVSLYASYDATTYGDLWPRRRGLIPHLAGGIVAACVGLIQLWLGLTGRTTVLHRTLGKIFLGAVAVGSAGGFYLALTIDPKFFAYATGLFMLSVAWALTTLMAYVAIRRRAVEQHREWMIRAYTVTFAFVGFRLFEKLLVNWHVASPDEIDTLRAWACWSVPLLLIEPLIQLRRLRRGTTR